MLKSLTLSRISESSGSKGRLVRFLEKADALDHLDIPNGLHNNWSYKAFDVITRFPNLELLSIPDIQEDWVHSLRYSNPISRTFPNLKHFYTRIFD
jgi:hypothetical protein